MSFEQIVTKNIDLQTINNIQYPSPPVVEQKHIYYASINQIPPDGSWNVIRNTFIPFDNANLGYSGSRTQIGTHITYDENTSLFSLNVRGIYSITTNVTVNVGDYNGFIASSGRLAVFDENQIQYGSDSGLYKSITIPGDKAQVFSFTVPLTIVTTLEVQKYGIYIIGDTEGFLISNSSVTITLLEELI